MSGEEVYQKLKNDPEFLHKLAEILKPEIALLVLNEYKKFAEELKKVNENLMILNKRVESLGGKVESLENWQKEAVKELTEIKSTLNNLASQQEIFAKQQEETNKRLERLEKQQERTNKELRYLRKAIENLVISIEEEAIEFLAHKLKKEFNLDVKVRSFEIENVVQFDIFAEFADKVILGEVKTRAGVRAVQQLENAIKTLLRVKPEFKNKKIIPMIYAKRYTEGLIEACEKKGIYLTSGLVDLTSFRLT